MKQDTKRILWAELGVICLSITLALDLFYKINVCGYLASFGFIIKLIFKID